jgi:hypothetical protein
LPVSPTLTSTCIALSAACLSPIGKGTACGWVHTKKPRGQGSSQYLEHLTATVALVMMRQVVLHLHDLPSVLASAPLSAQAFLSHEVTSDVPARWHHTKAQESSTNVLYGPHFGNPI